MAMLDLFLPDALQELQHGEGRVWGAIVRPARELEIYGKCNDGFGEDDDSDQRI